MDVYLKNEKEKDTFHFPVNPFGITLNRSKRYETVDIINVGEIDFTDNSKKIKELSFNTLFPIEYASFCKYRPVPNPIEVLKKLEKWMNQKDPVRLIITKFDFNDLVTISSISEDEKGGETGDKYISISFRVYREIKIEKLSSTDIKPALINNRTEKPKAKTYTVVPGDSLWKIAVRFYKNGVKWTIIYANPQNRKTIGPDPNRINPNQKLVIP